MEKLLEDKKTTYKTVRVVKKNKLDLLKQTIIDYKLKKNLTCDAVIAPRQIT